MSRTSALLAALGIVAAACGASGPTVTPTSSLAPTAPEPGPSALRADGAVRVLLGGDVMLGRGVAAILAEDPGSVFEEVRRLVSGAAVAAANLESPITERPTGTQNALAAPTEAASVLADAGFDVLGIANNHAGDGDPSAVTDTLAALDAHGLAAVGGGSDLAAAAAPVLIDAGGVRLAILAYDATGAGPPAGAGPGVVRWDAELVADAVLRARQVADVLIVGLHGGVEMADGPDRSMALLGDKLARLGVDVVWGHHAHAVQPLALVDPDGDARPTLVATSLGNLIFDQAAGSGAAGALLDLLIDREGLVAYRLARTEHHDLRVHFTGWDVPEGNAVLLAGEWWTPVRPVVPAPEHRLDDLADRYAGGDVLANSVGDPNLDGTADIVLAFRRPFQETPVTRRFPGVVWQDPRGRSAHLGVFGLDLDPVWVAGALFRPIASVAACDGAMAVGYSTLDTDEIIATGGWTWEGFGFTVAPDLVGWGHPACADVDGDGILEPVVVDRSPAASPER